MLQQPGLVRIWQQRPTYRGGAGREHPPGSLGCRGGLPHVLSSQTQTRGDPVCTDKGGASCPGPSAVRGTPLSMACPPKRSQGDRDGRENQRQGETGRDRERWRERQRDRKREIGKTEMGRERQRDKKRQGETETKRQKDREDRDGDKERG